MRLSLHILFPRGDRQVALTSDCIAECRESSYQLARGGLAVTGPESEGLAGCSFAVRSGSLKSANSPCLDIEAPGAFQPAFIWALVTKSGSNRPGREGWGGEGSTELHHRHSQVLKHRRNTAKGPPGLSFTLVPARALGIFQDSPGLGRVWEVSAGDSGVGKRGALSWLGHSPFWKPQRN